MYRLYQACKAENRWISRTYKIFYSDWLFEGPSKKSLTLRNNNDQWEKNQMINGKRLKYKMHKSKIVFLVRFRELSKKIKNYLMLKDNEI